MADLVCEYQLGSHGNASVSSVLRVLWLIGFCDAICRSCGKFSYVGYVAKVG